MSDPMGFYNDGFDGIEPNEGQLQDVLPEQWGVWEIADAEFRTSKEKATPSIHFRAVAADGLALTPKRSFFADVYLTEKTQSQIDRFTRATGLGFYDKRFGEKSGASDPRPQIVGEAQVEAAARVLAAALTGRRFIGKVEVEKGDKEKGYSDRNRFNGFNYFKLSEENTNALLAGGFGPKAITVKERELAGGRKERFLAAKGVNQVAHAGPTVARGSVIE